MGGFAGGIARLHAVLRDHRWTLEADLLRYYQVDLLDIHRGSLSWRRLLVLFRALPRESLTRITEHGVEPLGPAEVLLDELRRDALAIATKGHRRPDPWPGSPFALTPAQAEAQRAQRRREHERAEEREARRQERLRAQREED